MRLYAHGQGYDMVERPLIRRDETMRLAANMCLAVHPGFENERQFSVICDNYMMTAGASECLHRTPNDIFGQMSEHLGQGIYNGIWVGKDSKIPNVRGIRSDVVSALRAIKVPVVRWPGGCFADNYNWRDGVGPADKRPVTLNANWGLLEPNAFGTNEFMDFANQIGAAAYVAVDIGTGSVREASDWLEYMTVDKPTTLAKERASDGHPAPYEVKYIGMGNEMSGCGGAMSPADYVEHLKLYASNVDSRNPDQAPASLVRQRSPHAAMRVADGTDDDYVDAVMKAWQGHQSWSWSIEGLSLHHYTWGGAAISSPSTGFGEKEYAGLLKETMEMEGLIAQRSALMDKYDPQKSVALVVDEWGVWLKPLPGTNPMFLRQQNSLRDAIAASLNLNIFARHADRSLLFVNKKKQKNFVNWSAPAVVGALQVNKSFLLLFFKKDASSQYEQPRAVQSGGRGRPTRCLGGDPHHPRKRVYPVAFRSDPYRRAEAGGGNRVRFPSWAGSGRWNT
jgi:alpha-L-arabinofuranosidase